MKYHTIHPDGLNLYQMQCIEANIIPAREFLYDKGIMINIRFNGIDSFIFPSEMLN